MKQEARTLEIPTYPIQEKAEQTTQWIDIALPIIWGLVIFITVMNYRYTYWKRNQEEQ